ncbi:hypothetical protein B0G76_8387 [Paraburkholderia sp. BL23I1N1]|nr:hypothetical protein B0G76_8387 [Paraburkholderia sp. BL23I1N1]
MGRNVDSSRAGAQRGLGGLGHDWAGVGARRCVPQSSRGLRSEGGLLAGRKPSAQKKPGLLTPEQQRQEENGDAAASPATYRKDRPWIFGRVRNFFRSRARFFPRRLTACRTPVAKSDKRRQEPAASADRHPVTTSSSGCALIAWCAEPWRADRFPRDGLLHGRLRCCCQQPAGSGPCLVPTGVAARRRVAPGSPSRFARG